MKNYINIQTISTNEETLLNKGYQPLTASEIKEKIVGKYFLGGYLHGFKYIVAVNADGTLESKNDYEHYDHGKWLIDKERDTLNVYWQRGWDSTITRLYAVDESIHMYDAQTGVWRTSFDREIEKVDSIKGYLF